MEFTTGFELQSQATRLRWTAFTRRNKIPGEKTGLSPSPVPCSKGIYPGPPPGTPGTTPRRDWQHGLFPLQSPLLRESWLVSFPPLNYMLKFSGSSCVHQVQGKSLDGTSDSVSLVGACCGTRSGRARGPAEQCSQIQRMLAGVFPRAVALAMVSGDRLTTPASNETQGHQI